MCGCLAAGLVHVTQGLPKSNHMGVGRGVFLEFFFWEGGKEGGSAFYMAGNAAFTKAYDFRLPFYIVLICRFVSVIMRNGSF